MAKKPEAKSGDSAPRDERRAIIDALMMLANERDWDDIGLAAIATHAGLSLSQLRAHFPSKGAILAAYARMIDQAVLDGIDAGMADEPPRERLFDTLMRRLDAMAPHKGAIRSIMKGMMRDPLSLAALNQVAVNSMRWMLVASDIDAEGPLGAVRAQGLVIAWSRILKVWLDDEDAGLARTMTAIDKELRAGEGWLRRADDIWRMTRPFRHLAERACTRRSRMGERLKRRFEDFADMTGRRRSADRDAEAS
ncbi:MAG: TetR family transcriptional regulator [Labrys sp. (in: a-proteobacteria)]